MNKSEAKIQQEIVRWFRSNPDRGIIFSVPNESENVREQMRKKQIGLLTGVSDLVVMLPGGQTLYMEVKTPRGKQSESQRKFESKAVKLGHNYCVVRSLENAQQVVEQHTTSKCKDNPLKNVRSIAMIDEKTGREVWSYTPKDNA